MLPKLLNAALCLLTFHKTAARQALRRNLQQWQPQRVAAESWLTSQSIGQQGSNKLAIASYEAPHNSIYYRVCFVYDQAVAVFAYLAQGKTIEAEKILNQLMDWQQPSGSFYTAHMCESGGIWEYNQHVGPTIWVAMAALKYQYTTGDSTFYQMGDAAVRWSLQWQQADGGINGGIDWNNQPISWCSTEHNQDAHAVLRNYGYNSEATLVESFLRTKMWIPSEDRFMTGRNDAHNAMDVNPWAVLSLGSSYSSSLRYVDKTHRISSVCAGVDGFDFDATQRAVGAGYGTMCQWSQTHDDVWFEGTAFMAAAYRMIGSDRKADYFLGEIVKKQGTTGGIPYSCNGSCNQIWEMSALNSVAATGWFILAAAGLNPFDLSR